MSRTITPAMEAAEDALDAFGREAFPNYHSITEYGDYSLSTIVSREFDVCELLTGLGAGVDPKYQFSPSPTVASDTREAYEVACAIVRSQLEYWEGDLTRERLAGTAGIIDDTDEATFDRAMCILSDSSAVGELIDEYFRLEETTSEANAVAQLELYLELLDKTDNTYREAGWEL